jgi:hypothetical protein
MRRRNMENLVITGSEKTIKNAVLFLERASLHGNEVVAFNEVLNMILAAKPLSKFLAEFPKEPKE